MTIRHLRSPLALAVLASALSGCAALDAAMTVLDGSKVDSEADGLRALVRATAAGLEISAVDADLDLMASTGAPALTMMMTGRGGAMAAARSATLLRAIASVRGVHPGHVRPGSFRRTLAPHRTPRTHAVDRSHPHD